MKTKILLFVFLAASSLCLSQEKQEVFSSRSITFYGFDFALFAYVNPNDPTKTYDAEKIKDVYPVFWNTYVLEERPTSKLEKYFNKDTVYSDLSCITESAKMINEKTFIRDTPITLNQDEIQALLDSYNIPNPKTKVGLVCVVENFIKSTKYGTHATCYFVFFDTSSKKILMINKEEKGTAGGWTFRKYWGTALVRSVCFYTDDIYKKEQRKYKSKH
jgi:hypothetical protein